MINFWSTGRSVTATDVFHGWVDLIANALIFLGWFLFSISQLHGEDGKVGITGVVINTFEFTFYAAYLVAKLDLAGYMGTRVSTISFTHHCININLN